VANLGDANPIDNGGFFVLRDTTGVYPPEGSPDYGLHRDMGGFQILAPEIG